LENALARIQRHAISGTFVIRKLFDQGGSGEPSEMDQLFKSLTRGVKFSKDDLLSLKRKPEPVEESSEDDCSVDFFAPKKTSTDVSPDNPKLKTKTANPFKNVEDVNVYRKRKQIKVYGSDVPAPVRKFDAMLKQGVPEAVLVAVKKAGLKWPTPVQQQAVTLLSQNRDAFVVAPTGSGKTLAFLLGTLAKLSKFQEGEGKIRAIIVSPTRELAQQICAEMKRFLPTGASHKVAFLNKVLLNQWKSEPPKVFHEILVTNPLRLIHAVENKIVDLSSVQSLVLDEADKLFELGFLEQLDTILTACTCPNLQKCLFSATIPSGVEEAARSFMLDPVKVVIGAPNAAAARIEQKLVYVGQEEGKLLAIRQMLQTGGPEHGLAPPVIIFTETIERAQALLADLRPLGIRIDAIHSERTPAEREAIIKDFRSGRLWFLVTTELLARGLDFPDVSCVINYDFPCTTASYIHRIGRTARAGKQGKAITLFTKDDANSLRTIVNVMRQSGCEVPEWMLQVKPKLSKKAKECMNKQKKKSKAALDES